MSTRQKYGNSPGGATIPPTTSQTVNSDPQTPPTQAERQQRQFDRVTIEAAVGNQVHELFFMLLGRHRELQDTLCRCFATGELDDAASTLIDVEDVEELLTQLVTNLNWKAEYLEDQFRDSEIIRQHEGKSKEIEAKWREWIVKETAKTTSQP